MKILFYNHTGQVSGAERVLLMSLDRLNRKRFDPVVVCPPQGPLQKMAAAAGARTETLPALEARFTWRVVRLARYLKSFFQVIRELRSRVMRFGPDLIHANSIRAGLVATAATLDLGTPVVWHLHDLLPRHPFSAAIRIFASLSARTRMIAVSEAVARNFRGRLGWAMKKRVNVILNCIDLTRVDSNQVGGRSVRDGLGLNGAHPVLGIVGQLTPRKGQLELLRAFAQTLRQLPQAVLLIVGAPPFNRDHEYAERLERETQALGIADRVFMLGQRSDIPAIMRALDVLVINSSAEPFGLVALEAMACGTVVLAAATGGLPEIIEHNQNGWLVAQGDERKLAKAMVHLSAEPALRARLAMQGKETVFRDFSADRYIEELESFYQSGVAGVDSKPKTAAIRQARPRQSPGLAER